MTLAQILALANSLSPFIAPTVVGVTAIVGALKGAGVPEEHLDDDFRALIAEALAAKAEADRAARGEDVR